MEAARVAALRGHNVILYEKNATLGGQINIADKGPYGDALSCFTAFLTAQLEKLGVRIELNKEVTDSLIESVSPDVIILATGSRPVVPPIPGVKQDNVIMANDILQGSAATGNRVVVIGGGRVGLEVAELLQMMNKEVTVVEMLRRIGDDLGFSTRYPTLSRLKQLGIKLLPQTKAVRIKGNSVVIVREESESTLPADTVVLAAGSQANNDLEKALAGKAEIHAIGDCVQPRNIMEAILEGTEVAHAI